MPAFEQARQALEKATRFDDVKGIRDKAEALRAYAAAAKDRETEFLAVEIRMRAERRAGEILIHAKQHAERRSGGRPKTVGAPDRLLPSLADLGIRKDEASLWMKLAQVPLQHFEARIARMREGNARAATRGFFAQAFSSASDEYLTPPEILEAVVALFEQIDLDPCAERRGPRANVPARVHFTAKEDGLSQAWQGRVFMNPPYGDAVAAWVEKLLSSRGDQGVVEAIALVAARIDTEWFRQLAAAGPWCGVAGRLRFRPAGDPAPFPSALFYLGMRAQKFAAIFSKLGPVYRSIAP